MTLAAPNLDDRRFQNLVDEAKRMVQQRCPEWSDHNVSDPGVTLIETFAFMVDQLIYRLNRVPDLDYIKFLDLIGVRLFPPTAAHAEVTFWLSAPQREVIRIPLSSEVATLRTEMDEAISFTTTRQLDIVPCSLGTVGSMITRGRIRDHVEDLSRGDGFYCFAEQPKVDDTLLVGLSNAVPSCAVDLRLECEIEGVGVDPRWPPLAWEAWNGEAWEACDVGVDETGGLNSAGDIVLHVPATHQESALAKRRAGWLRCRVVEAEEGQPTYSASPRITKMSAFTIGGTAPAEHGKMVTDEILGVSEGVPGQKFVLAQGPVVASEERPVLGVATDEGGWEEWEPVGSFADSEEADKHFILDESAATVELAPAVREGDGTLHLYGAVPPNGAVLRLRSYRTGGGKRGNVARGAISVLKSSIPYVTSVQNRRPAAGGVDGETLDAARVRGPILLRTRSRAVTAEDYEALAREAAPEVARVRCVPAGGEDGDSAVRVLVVPAAADNDVGGLQFEQLIPSEYTLARIADYLDERRVIGTRIIVEPPLYQGLTVVARLRARSHADPHRVQMEALIALNRYFHPISGGPEGNGWPFGRPIQAGEIHAVLQALSGVELIEEALLYGANPVTGERGDPTSRIEVKANGLAFSYRHSVLCEAG